MKGNDKNIIPIELIALVLSGEADISEENALERWASESEENSIVLKKYKSLWERTGKIIPLDDIDVNDEWKRFSKNKEGLTTNPPKSRTISMFTKLAAAVSIGLIIGFSAIFTYNTIKFENLTAVAEVRNITLPDGSHVTLYPGTGIKYPKSFHKEKREIKLDGEAFFDVQRDTLRVFSIRSGDMLVKVLGTSFNIEAYKSSDSYKVIVEEGKVAVSSIKNIEKTIYLIPGEKALFNSESNNIEKSVNKDINFDAWRTNSLVFEDSSPKELASILSKVFIINISAETVSEDLRFTATFENESLDYILETIRATLDISSEEKEGSIILY